MPQNPPNITESPEFKEFCKNANLEVYNLESIALLLFSNSLIINSQQKEIFELREMINEIAKNILIPTNSGWNNRGYSLFDKWNKNGK